MSSQPSGSSRRGPDRQQAVRHAEVALRSIGQPNSVAGEFDFWDDRYEGRRLFSELLGTFFLVLVAVGGGMVNARFGGHAVPDGAQVVAPALMVMAIILFMGTVSGAHLNPAVSIAFAVRGDFPWRRVPAYVVAQFLGAVLATLLLWALIGKQGRAGLTLPGSGISTTTAMLWEIRPDRRAGQRDPGHRVRRPAGRAAGRPRRGQLHRAGRAVGLAGQRSVDEPGPLARARAGERRLDRMVGLPRRPGGRRRSSRWASPTSCAAAAADAAGSQRPRARSAAMAPWFPAAAVVCRRELAVVGSRPAVPISS